MIKNGFSNTRSRTTSPFFTQGATSTSLNCALPHYIFHHGKLIRRYLILYDDAVRNFPPRQHIFLLLLVVNSVWKSFEICSKKWFYLRGYPLDTGSDTDPDTSKFVTLWNPAERITRIIASLKSPWSLNDSDKSSLNKDLRMIQVTALPSNLTSDIRIG